MSREDALTPPQFVLHGIAGVYNYGCEAIVRGTVDILRAVWPNCEILYQSRRPTEDAASLAGCDVLVVDGRVNLSLPRRVVRSALYRAHLPWRWLSREPLEWAIKSDCLISIGGDIFTLPTKRFHSRLEFPNIDFAQQVMATRTKFVLWAASVGPFDGWPEAGEVFLRMLRNVDLITVREQITFDYLQAVGLNDRAVRVADPAFLMPPQQVDDDFPFLGSPRLTLAINLSPLSARHVVGTANVADLQSEQAAMLKKVMDELDVNILLVPHVVCSWDANDDDYSYLAQISNALGSGHSERVALLPPSLGAMRTKGVLSQCDALIAARMHCGIAGVSCGVPTLFLAYSHKAAGMAEYVYGHEEWALPLAQLAGNEAIQKVDSLLRSRSELERRLLSDLPKFQQDAMRGGQALRQILCDGPGPE